MQKKNLLDFKKLADENNLKFCLYKGTLLGAIRENDFITHDEDTDLSILEEDKDALFELTFKLQKIGFEIIRFERRGILSIMRNNEYIDFYIFKKYAPNIRACGNIFVLERFLFETTLYEFKSKKFRVPEDYFSCLNILYGKDWMNPIKYANFKMSAVQILSSKLRMKIKDLLPNQLFFFLLKINARKRKKIFDQKINELTIPIAV